MSRSARLLLLKASRTLHGPRQQSASTCAQSGSKQGGSTTLPMLAATRRTLAGAGRRRSRRGSESSMPSENSRPRRDSVDLLRRSRRCAPACKSRSSNAASDPAIHITPSISALYNAVSDTVVIPISQRAWWRHGGARASGCEVPERCIETEATERHVCPLRSGCQSRPLLGTAAPLSALLRDMRIHRAEAC